MSKFILLLADRPSLFEFKSREPLGIYPIPVTIMKDIPQQANGREGCLLLGNLWTHANLLGVANMLLVVPCQAQD
nr:hypothetical protein TIFTF001_054711 [Ficus carica]GMN72347.1 hypothetical protein TIFTF001_054713 [Ficus carica]